MTHSPVPAQRPNILSVVNPRAHRVVKRGSALGAAHPKIGGHLHVIQDFDFAPLVERAISDRHDWVMVEGGDGTLSAVIGAFLDRVDALIPFPRFTVVPGGNTNQVSKSVGLSRHGIRAVEDLVFAGHAVEVRQQALRVERDNTVRHGFLFTTGAVPMATDYAKSKMHGRGITGSLAVAATLLQGLGGVRTARAEFMRPTDIELMVSGPRDHTQITGAHLGTLVTTLPCILNGLDPFWGEGPGAIKLTYIDGEATMLLGQLAGLMVGMDRMAKDSAHLESFRADRLQFDYAGPVVIDGEPLDGDGPITVTASPLVTFVK